MVSAYVISICFLKVGNTIRMSEIIFPILVRKGKERISKPVDWVV